MPLNPNGKIDKPVLPFPDTAQLASIQHRVPTVLAASEPVTATERTLQAIWATLLPDAFTPIPLTDDFFDLGGHSILATRLIFEIRKSFVVNAPLGLVFDRPTIRGLAGAIDELRDADFGFTWEHNSDTPAAVVDGQSPQSGTTQQVDYASDFEHLRSSLKSTYPSLPLVFPTGQLTIFLTGASGFLGAFILRDLLSSQTRVKKVICLVRAPTSHDALRRLQDSGRDRGVWNDAWVKESRLEVVTGDLSQPKFGLDGSQWSQISEDADVILHNGAWVRF